MSKICCFAGHREIYQADRITDEIIRICERLIIEDNVTEFMVGNYGRFDLCAKIAVERLKDKYPGIKLLLVIPYLTASIIKDKNINNEYDEIIIADIPKTTPNRYKIIKCNEYMIKKADYLICYITVNWGGAYKTVEYAKKQKNIIIYNLGNLTIY